MRNELKERIEVARGMKKADFVLKGGRVVNVFSGEIYETDIAVYKGKFAGLGNYEAKKVIDVSSRLILPGFINSHVHIESSMLTPPKFAKAALLHGTTAVVADPHEIANVLGKKGIEYVLKSSKDLPLDIYIMLPSCVPATNLETSGARLAASDLAPFLKHERVLGLAEVMNYPGVLRGEPQVIKKLEAFGNSRIDGHAPGLSGIDLSAYIGAGITSDHECTTAEEAREKIRLGMTIFMREGSSAKDLEALVPAVTPANSRFFCLATDDLDPDDLKNGGVDLLIKKALRLGLDPMTAVRMATINPARYFGLKNKGAILPGYDADMVVIDNFNDFNVEMVFKKGRLAVRKNKMMFPVKDADHAYARNSVKIRPVTRNDIRLKAGSYKARVIELIPDQIETRHSILPVAVRNGYVVSDIERDILKLLVIERHKASGNIAFGLVKGFGLESGALAGTVAHDSHNIITVGVSDEDIFTAIMEIKRMQGGLVVVNNGKVLARLPLPVAGLMSDKPLNFVVRRLAEIKQAVKILGAAVEHPFSILSFLALPVIPELKLTDKGLVDVNLFRFVELFV